MKTTLFPPMKNDQIKNFLEGATHLRGGWTLAGPPNPQWAGGVWCGGLWILLSKREPGNQFMSAVVQLIQAAVPTATPAQIAEALVN